MIDPSTTKGVLARHSQSPVWSPSLAGGHAISLSPFGRHIHTRTHDLPVGHPGFAPSFRLPIYSFPVREPTLEGPPLTACLVQGIHDRRYADQTMLPEVSDAPGRWQ